MRKGHHFCPTFKVLEPGISRDQVHRCIEKWNRGDHGMLGLSKAYRRQVAHVGC